MMKKAITSELAPSAIGTYSQAIKTDHAVYLSGQIPLDPKTMTIVADDFVAQAAQVFINLQKVSQAAGGDLDAIVKLTIYLTDMTHLSLVNETMAQFFHVPYPARTTVAVAALPKSAKIEIEAIMVLKQEKNAL